METGRDEALAAALLGVYDVAARTSEVVTPVLEQHGLTFNTAYVLWAVDPDQPAPTMRTLAERTHCAPANLTFLCDRLEARGLIERRPAVTDRRQRVVHLSPVGRQARDVVVSAILGSSPLGTLDARQLTDLRQILSVALKQPTGATPPATPTGHLAAEL